MKEVAVSICCFIGGWILQVGLMDLKGIQLLVLASLFIAANAPIVADTR